MMKIAVACNGEEVAAHFGHCENFTIFKAEKGMIIDKEIVKNPGHRPGFLPNFLNELDVNVIISGGMGGAAVDIFNSHEIEVIIGNPGKAQEVVERYLKGELKSTGSVCHSHNHE